jgi:hypothetical protein
MHHGIIKTLRGIVEEARVPKVATVEEARGLCPGDAIRPGDIVVLDFAEAGRHLIIDGVVTTVNRNIILSRVSTMLGFVAKHAEDKKFKADADSPKPVAATHGGCHRLVPFVMEDGGTIGAHGQAALRMLAEYAIAKGKVPPEHCTQQPPPPQPRW